MIFNFMLFITASVYWYMTGHALPAIIGYLVLLMFHEKLAFYTIIMSGVGIGTIIYLFWLDYSTEQVSYATSEHGLGVIYMFVLLIKAKKIFDWDDMALD